MDDRLDHAPCGWLAFDDGGIVVAANATVLSMLGYAAAEVVGRPLADLLTVGGRIFYQTHWFPLLRLHGRAEEVFLLLRGAGGAEVGVLSNAVRRERDGAMVTECALMQVRERRKYEDELLRARKASDEARLVLERQQRELRDAYARLEEQAAELEVQQHQLQEQAVELETAGEELSVINETLHERTVEAERLRDVADQANRAKSSFLAVMSHELRTPLNAIAGYLELLELEIYGPVTDAQREAMGHISRSQRHLLRLINDVLNLARIESGRVDYQAEPVVLAEVLKAILPMIEPQLDAKRIRFEAAVPPELIAIADRDKTQQILLNLLSNAMKFTPAGGSVEVEAEAVAEGEVALRVRDNGVGIARANLATIFEPFIQVDTSRTRAAEGSGLGLAISRDLARGMGGDLSADSVLGVGSTFEVRLRAAGGGS